MTSQSQQKQIKQPMPESELVILWSDGTIIQGLDLIILQLSLPTERQIAMVWPSWF